MDAAVHTENATGVGDSSTPSAFDALDRAMRSSGPEAALDELIRHLVEKREFRALLDALLLKARHELGLPLIHEGSLDGLDEPVRSAFEARYVEAIRTVGRHFLDSGDIAGAWPYFRAIGEPDPVAAAIVAYEPTVDDERLGAVIEVAFNQGAEPRRGYELILDHYGTCSAITAFDHLPQEEAIRAASAERLVTRLHEDLVASLRAEILQRGQPLPAVGAPIAELIDNRPWLFADDAYHIDLSHLGAVVRLSPLVRDRAARARAVELTDYGRRLSDRHRTQGEPPFENHYEDHAVYLRALQGDDVDAAVEHFRAKLAPAVAASDGESGDDPGEADEFGPGNRLERSQPAQVLVDLLLRLDRLDDAIEVADDHLAGIPDSSLRCPSVAQLCQRSGQPERLARIARAQGDLVHYAAAILQSRPGAGKAP